MFCQTRCLSNPYSIDHTIISLFDVESQNETLLGVQQQLIHQQQNLQQLSQQHQTLLDNQQQVHQENQTIQQQLLDQNQAIMNRLGKSSFQMTCMRFSFSTFAQIPWPIVVVTVLYK